MKYIWQLIAYTLASNPRLVDWLIARAKRTPYRHITSADGNHTYMGRWWLFNPYGRSADNEQTPARWPWLPSVRLHHIKRADQDRHLHDHPWNARTIVMRGWYAEERLPASSYDTSRTVVTHGQQERREHNMCWAGYTGRLLFGQYHRISEVSPGGVWTLFITWKYRGTWGFMVNGCKVPWRVYLGIEKRQQT